MPLAAELRTLKAELAYLVAELARARAEEVRGEGGEGGEGGNSGAADEEVRAVVAAANQKVAAAEARAEARAEAEAGKAAAAEATAEAAAAAAANRAAAAEAAAAAAHGSALDEVRGDHGRQLEAISISHGAELEEIRQALQLRGAELERERAGFVKGGPAHPPPQQPAIACWLWAAARCGPERSAPATWVPMPKRGFRRRSGGRFKSPRCRSSNHATSIAKRLPF